MRSVSKVNWKKRLVRLTVEKKTLEGFLDLELGVEDDEPEGDGEDVVASSALEIVSEHVESIVVALLILDGGEMRSRASAGGGNASEDPGRVWREICAHRHLIPLYALSGSLGKAGRRDCVTHMSRLRGSEETRQSTDPLAFHLFFFPNPPQRRPRRVLIHLHASHHGHTPNTVPICRQIATHPCLVHPPDSQRTRGRGSPFTTLSNHQHGRGGSKPARTAA